MLKLLFTSLLCCCIFLTSCAAILNGSRDTLRIDSDPQGAKVYIDGSHVGRTPIAYSVDQKIDHTVDFRLEGYESISRIVTSSLGAGWIVADLIFTGLLGILIDAATHSWNSLDQRYVRVVLEQKDKK